MEEFTVGPYRVRKVMYSPYAYGRKRRLLLSDWRITLGGKYVNSFLTKAKANRWAKAQISAAHLPCSAVEQNR